MKEIEIPEGYEARIEGNKVIIVPKESEDEKIRKAIIRLLQNGGYMEPQDKEKAFAWLEKQKEQKPIEDVVKEITKNKEAATKFLKSASIMNDNGELVEMYRSEQKPAEWSEEDERTLQQLLIHLEGEEWVRNHGELENLHKWQDWLKALRPQPHWKPSEEQMTVLEIACKYEGVFTQGQLSMLLDLKEQLKKL